jgi:ribonuclease HI
MGPDRPLGQRRDESLGARTRCLVLRRQDRHSWLPGHRRIDKVALASRSERTSRKRLGGRPDPTTSRSAGRDFCSATKPALFCCARGLPRCRHGRQGPACCAPEGASVALCERAADVVRQTAGIVASPNDLTFDLWTDGACAGNPGGPGGYAAVLVARRADGSIAKQWETSGGEPATTNNRMELMAVVAGLRELPASARVRIHIDSSYVLNTFTQGRRERWQANGWRTSARKPVKNRELWEQLFTEVDRHQELEWVKVAGHTGVELNERADQLACAQRDAHDRR